MSAPLPVLVALCSGTEPVGDPVPVGATCLHLDVDPPSIAVGAPVHTFTLYIMDSSSSAAQHERAASDNNGVACTGGANDTFIVLRRFGGVL